jgi:predicted membrane protein
LASLILFDCNSFDSQKTETVEIPNEINVVGAMKNIIVEGELLENREVKRQQVFYNLDAIISVAIQ